MNKALIIFLVFIFFSCNTIKYSFTGASIPEDVNTFSVEYFNSVATLSPPTLSQTFTEDLKDVFLEQTRLAIVSEGGDLHFSGAITNYKVDPIGVTGDEVAAKNRLSITVNVNFVNSKHPESNYESRFTRFFDFDNNQELAGIEDQLIEEINAQLVQDIFNKAVGDW